MEHYSEALTLYPPSCEHEIAVCYANRAACHMKMVPQACDGACVISKCSSIRIGHTCQHLQEDHQNVIDDCTKGIIRTLFHLWCEMEGVQ